MTYNFWILPNPLAYWLTFSGHRFGAEYQLGQQSAHARHVALLSL